MATETATATETQQKHPYCIVTVAGPTAVALDLTLPGPIRIGRRAGHDVQLGDPASRDHAMLVWSDESGPGGEDGHWILIDTGSKHGTKLNGEQLTPQQRYPLQHNDLIQVTHWTLQLIDVTLRRSDTSYVSVVDDDSAIDATMISEVRTTDDYSRRHLKLLLECAQAIHNAADSTALAEAVLDAVVKGTKLPNAAYLKPLGSDGVISVMAQRGAILSKQGRPNLSRTLIERASGGVPVRMDKSQNQMISGASIVELGIDEAMCVPIMLGETVAGFIYLDSRKQELDISRITTDASDFVLGLSQIAAMAMANLMRMDLQKRYMRIEAEVAAAAEAQRWVLPTRQGAFSKLSYLGESRPGKVVSGDFFDVIQLDEDRLAVTLGDVSGKGIAASVLMTVAQGFMHAALAEHGDPARAVADLNAYVEPRCATGRFVTLWAGVFDAKENKLTYIDAGHGYALLSIMGPDGKPILKQLNEGGGMPIGILSGEGGCEYVNAETSLEPGSRMLVVSDGLIEQTGHGALKNDEFGFERLKDVLHKVKEGDDEITAIFAAIESHAAGALADDATAVLVRRHRD